MITTPMHSAWAADVDAILARDLPWHKLSGAKVLVTGAAGFLGGYLTRTLLALHAAGKVDAPVRVVAMVRSLPRARTRFADLLQRSDFELFEWDLNRIAVPELPRCSHVLHAASQASPRFYGSDPVGTLMPNAIGTAALLEALCRQPDPQAFLFVSSSEVYGTVPGDVSLPETQYGSVDPASVRATTKHQCETWASEVQTFWPLMTHWSPSSTALVCTLARSEPALGSL